MLRCGSSLQLDELERTTCYIDLRLVLKGAKTRDTLAWAGGRWDRLDLRFVDQGAPKPGRAFCSKKARSSSPVGSRPGLREFREGRPRRFPRAGRILSNVGNAERQPVA
jgi:hypothetical protein